MMLRIKKRKPDQKARPEKVSPLERPTAALDLAKRKLSRRRHGIAAGKQRIHAILRAA